MRDYQLVSTDSHLEVPPTMWSPYVDAEFREFVPKVVKLANGGDAWLMPGKSQPVPLGLNFSAGRGFENLKFSGLSYDEGLVGAGDGAQRLSEMDQDEVDAEVLFPAVSGQRTLDTGALPREAYVALVRGYNDWLSQEYTAADPERLLGLAMLPVTGLEDAMDELRRVSTMPGIRGVVLHQWPNGRPLPAPEDDAFWKLAVELDVPLTAHVFIGGEKDAEAAWYAEHPPSEGVTLILNWVPINWMLTKGGNGYTATQMITSGVFDRIPGLQLFFAETSIGWIPNYIEQAEDNLARHKYWAGLELPHDFGWYVRNHTHWGFQIDTYGVKYRHDIGVDRIQWSTDFPHVQCDWPHSGKVIEQQFADIPEDEKRAIVRDNALRYFRLAA